MRIKFGLTIAFVLMGLVGLILVLLPLLSLLMGGLPTLGSSEPISLWSSFSDPIFRKLIFTSVTLAVQVTMVTLLIGVPIGILLGFSRGPMMKVLGGLHILPLCLPPYIIALSWGSIVGSGGIFAKIAGESAGIWTSNILYSHTGCVIVFSLAFTPIISLLTALFVRSIDSSFCEAGLLNRSMGPVIWRVILPMAAPGIALGALLVFVLTLSEVALPQFLGLNVYSTVIFSRMADLSFQPGEALALAFPLIATAIIASFILQKLDKKGRGIVGLSLNPPLVAFQGVFKWVSLILFVIFIIVTTIPVLSLLHRALFAEGGGWQGFYGTRKALWNTLNYSVAAATLMLVISLPFAYLWSRYPKVGRILTIPILLGFVLPATALGLGLMTLWNRSSTQWIYRGDAIVVLGFTARYLFLPLRTLKLGFDGIPPSWEEVALLQNRSLWQRFIKIIIPLNLRLLTTAWIFGFLISIRDQETAILFYPPGGESLSIRTLTLEANSPPGLTAASATTQVALVLIVLTLLILINPKRSHLK
jgi:iron(III) transport system permease protein